MDFDKYLRNLTDEQLKAVIKKCEDFILSQNETRKVGNNEHTKEVIGCMIFPYMSHCDDYPHMCNECNEAIKDD